MWRNFCFLSVFTYDRVIDCSCLPPQTFGMWSSFSMILWSLWLYFSWGSEYSDERVKSGSIEITFTLQLQPPGVGPYQDWEVSQVHLLSLIPLISQTFTAFPTSIFSTFFSLGTLGSLVSEENNDKVTDDIVLKI